MRITLVTLGTHGDVPPPIDWPSRVHVTGYWFLDASPEWRPLDELKQFIDSGTPPIVIGFGSLARGDTAALTDLILDAITRSGQRAVLLTGWGGIERRLLPSSVFVADAVPHDWLLPRASAVIHHGGAGTLAAAMRAGTPSVIVPMAWDHPYWGRRAYELGVAPRPIPIADLSPANLANAINHAVNSERVRERSHAVVTLVRAEDGIGNAVALVQQHLSTAAGS